MLKAKSTKIFTVVMLIILVAVTATLGTTLFAAETSDFNQLNKDQLVSSMGAAWNLGNQLEANSNGTPSETVWGNPTITQNLINKVKAAGFNTIRIPVSYLSKIGSAPNYTVDSAWLNRIKEVVDYAYNQNMFVIINMHGDGYTNVTGGWLLVTSGDQTTIKDKYSKVWAQIANKFVNYDERLIFESMNEVFNGTWSTPDRTQYSNLNAYNQVFVDTVRKTGGNNAARWLLIPGWNTNIEHTTGDYGFVMPTDNNRSSSIPSSEKRIIMSVHYYDPWDFCGEESGAITQWGATATNSSKKSTWGQEDYMDLMIKKVYDTFVTQGYPFVIGEYGSINKTNDDSSNNTYRQAFAKALTSTTKKYGGVAAYWDNGYNGNYGFGLFDRNSATVTQQGIIDAIMAGTGSIVVPPPVTVPVTPTPVVTTAVVTTQVVTQTPVVTTPVTQTSAPVVTSPPVGTGVTATTSIANDWGTGGQMNISIKNNGSSATNGWSVSISVPGTIVNLWCAKGSGSGTVTLTNEAWNGVLQPGQSTEAGLIYTK